MGGRGGVFLPYPRQPWRWQGRPQGSQWLREEVAGSRRSGTCQGRLETPQQLVPSTCSVFFCRGSKSPCSHSPASKGRSGANPCPCSSQGWLPSRVLPCVTSLPECRGPCDSLLTGDEMFPQLDDERLALRVWDSSSRAVIKQAAMLEGPCAQESRAASALSWQGAPPTATAGPGSRSFSSWTWRPMQPRRQLDHSSAGGDPPQGTQLSDAQTESKNTAILSLGCFVMQ